MSITKTMMAATIGMTLACAAVQAAPIMPDFTPVPAGWTTDRYAPASFSNVGTYAGHTNVLGIGITSAGDLKNRPSGQNTSFYDTQGKGHAVSGGADSILAADLYIPTGWGDASNGYARTDMWGVMSNTSNADLDYAIIGFTNYGGAARLRVWDGDVTIAGDHWIDLLTPLASNDWMALSIELTNASYIYKVNGATVYTDSTIGLGTQFSSVLMQAYNFADPARGDPTPVTVDYTAYWSNTQAAAVPEPSSIALLGVALFGFGVSRRRTRANMPK